MGKSIIRIDSKPMQVESQDVSIPADGIQLKAYLARPSGAANTPGVVVIHENKGLDQYLRDVADGLASAGYIAVAPDLLSREGGTDSFGDPAREIPPKIMGLSRDRVDADTGATLNWVKRQPGVTRVGIVGFCWGGGVAWRMAASHPDLKAAVPFYGANPPLDQVPNIRAAVFGIYGELDERINVGIAAITDALQRGNITYEKKVYPWVGHAFHNHYNPPGRYNAEAAKQAWSDAIAWLDKHLKG